MAQSSDAGFLESSISRTRSLLRSSKQSSTLNYRRSLQVLSFSHKSSIFETEPQSCTGLPGLSPIHDAGLSSTSITAPAPPASATMFSSSPPTKKNSTRRFSSIGIKSKAPKKKKSTILRAVPASAACAAAAALSPLERDMATLPNQEILSSIGRTSPTSDAQASYQPSTNAHTHTLPKSTGSPVRSRSRNSVALTASSPTQNASDSKFPDLKGVIGTYTQGKIEWGYNKQKTSASPSFRTHSAASTRRPRIQVVIPLPKEQRDRPLPTSPFFSSPTKSRFRSPSTTMPSIDDVSPPSATKKFNVRSSVGAPLNAIQERQPPITHPAIDTHIPKPDLDLLGPNNIIFLSNSSSEESQGEDASSASSNCSSRTSVHETETETKAAPPPPMQSPISIPHKRSPSANSSNKSPVVAKKSGAEANVTQKSEGVAPETGPRVAPLTLPFPRRYAPHPPINEDFQFQPTCALRPSRRTVTMPAVTLPPIATPPSLSRKPTITRKSSKRQSSHRRSLLVSPTMGVINHAVFRVEPRQYPEAVRSPTLSEAENELEQHLTCMTEDNPFQWDELIPSRSSLDDDMNDDLYSPPPVVPRKSSKRQSSVINPHFRFSKVPENHIASQLKRLRSSSKVKALKLNIPQKSKRMTEDDFILSPILIGPVLARNNIKSAIPQSVAENVILAILQSLDTFDDLFATAVVNKGFYQVFKAHELDLMKGALRKMSPPAWEHRELCYPGHDQHTEDDDVRMEYTPTAYLQYYTRDVYIIEALKGLISEKCQSFLRPEIFLAITNGNPSEVARVDDALWRIWSFCKIFGCGKGREEDIVAQMDWLKGGILVHQKTCTFSILTTDALDMNDTLASAPECFAKGNEGGLTAEQLFDMMELWNCLGVLLQPFEGRTIQAREHGLYDNTEVRGGDIDGEELMLDEWYYYLLTLGLSPILDLAGPLRASDSSAFVLAKQHGWINWNPPVFGGTRRNFLKEATSRVYEDKIATVYAESSSREVQRQISKQRIQRHITELRKRKNSGERLEEVRQSQERPMSEWEGVLNNLTRPRPPLPSNANLVSHIPTLRSAAPASTLAQQLTSIVSEMPANEEPISPERPRSPPRRIVAQPLLPSPPPSTVPSVADRSSIFSSMPSIDEHPAFRVQPSETIPEVPDLAQHPAFRQHLQHLESQTTSSPSLPTQTRPEVPSRSITYPATATISPLSSTPSSQGIHPANRSPTLSQTSGSHPVFAQHPLQREIYATDVAENTADKAIYRIVEMGFTPEQARRALRQTDLGDGLSIERAVNMLLREM